MRYGAIRRKLYREQLAAARHQTLRMLLADLVIQEHRRAAGADA